MSALFRKDKGIGLVNFNATDIWFAPGDAINSTAAFNHATHLENQAYIANRWLFVSMIGLLVILIILQFPYTYFRLKNSPSWWYNYRLSPTKKILDPKPGQVARPPYRLRHINLHIPNYTVPFIALPLSQFLAIFVLWAAGLGVAGWCQASFLTDASRSTLVVMFFMALAAGLGIKAGGVGTWLVYGYTAVNFLHRWTGRLVLLLSTLHVVAYLVVFYKDGGEFAMRCALSRHNMTKADVWLI